MLCRHMYVFSYILEVSRVANMLQSMQVKVDAICLAWRLHVVALLVLRIPPALHQALF